MVDAILKKEEERKALENKYKKQQDKNDKLVKQLTGQFAIQGARHLIWDMIIAGDFKLIPYLGVEGEILHPGHGLDPMAKVLHHLNAKFSN